MTIAPDFDTFAKAYEAGEAGVLRATLVGDLLTPVAAFLKLRHERKGSAFLLESVEGGTTRGRYSMIGLDPDLIWRADNGRAEINRRALTDPGGFEPCAAKPLDSLRALLRESTITQDASLPP